MYKPQMTVRIESIWHMVRCSISAKRMDQNCRSIKSAAERVVHKTVELECDILFIKWHEKGSKERPHARTKSNSPLNQNLWSLRRCGRKVKSDQNRCTAFRNFKLRDIGQSRHHCTATVISACRSFKIDTNLPKRKARWVFYYTRGIKR